ncbi:MAG: recombinase family protein, partial [Fimbriiglobus sp.]
MSTDQQHDSPARQRQDIEALATRQGFRITRWYEDHGQTGTESGKRKEFQKLLADAMAGTFQAVLLSEQSRMSREEVVTVHRPQSGLALFASFWHSDGLAVPAPNPDPQCPR